MVERNIIMGKAGGGDCRKKYLQSWARCAKIAQYVITHTGGQRAGCPFGGRPALEEAGGGINN